MQHVLAISMLQIEEKNMHYFKLLDGAISMVFEHESIYQPSTHNLSPTDEH
jgi:hypothetical protein